MKNCDNFKLGYCNPITTSILGHPHPWPVTIESPETKSEKRKKLEEEKGIIIRFVIGHSATSGGILDRAIEAEDKKHGDFLRLDHVEGYLELSAKTKTYFATAVNMWDADFYIKVDDDVHAGNKYFRHATGQLYAISKDLATYISTNQHVLHKYANEDVSLGAWCIGLDVDHIDDRRLCCGTPPGEDFSCIFKYDIGLALVYIYTWYFKLYWIDTLRD
ncbi:Glycosyl transferase, family 31 [Sesbania bispinosa]|nr:Glycosyl transferase, family 31 [Sesbania bispinosa]